MTLEEAMNEILKLQDSLKTANEEKELMNTEITGLKATLTETQINLNNARDLNNKLILKVPFVTGLNETEETKETEPKEPKVIEDILELF